MTKNQILRSLLEYLQAVQEVPILLHSLQRWDSPCVYRHSKGLMISNHFIINYQAVDLIGLLVLIRQSKSLNKGLLYYTITLMQPITYLPNLCITGSRFQGIAFKISKFIDSITCYGVQIYIRKMYSVVNMNFER